MKTLQESALIGKIAIIYPPVGDSGDASKLGVIKLLDNGVSQLILGFQEGGETTYNKDELLFLLPKLMRDCEIPNGDLDVILRITRLIKKMFEGLSLAMRTETTKSFCLINCAKWRDMQIDKFKKVGRKQTR